ncbi:hypothetical protein [Nocardiopsis synnemataformans]|uniref:hypothetical protein n=1 Tax=Nocardiopsis synnemataformans TaxID=61305 RepID=UPI003EB73FC7
MRELMEALVCDQCGEALSAPASRLAEKAQRCGWQVRFLLGAWASEDDGGEFRTDRCPSHPATSYAEGEWEVWAVTQEQKNFDAARKQLAAAGFAPTSTTAEQDEHRRLELSCAGQVRAEEAVRLLRGAGVLASGAPVPQPCS